MVTTLNNRLDYFGTTVEAANGMLELAAAGQLLASQAVVDNRDVAQRLGEASQSAEVVTDGALDLIVQRYFLGGTRDRS